MNSFPLLLRRFAVFSALYGGLTAPMPTPSRKFAGLKTILPMGHHTRRSGRKEEIVWHVHGGCIDALGFLRGVPSVLSTAHGRQLIKKSRLPPGR